MDNLNQVSTLPPQIQDQTAQDLNGTPVANVTVVIPTRDPDAPATPLRHPSHTRNTLIRTLPVQFASAFSTAAVTSGESGVTFDSKRDTILPFLSTRNLVKFHLTSPPVFSVR